MTLEEAKADDGAIYAQFVPEDRRAEKLGEGCEDNREGFVELVKTGVFPHDGLTVDTSPVGDTGPWSAEGVTLIENATLYGKDKAVVRMSVSDFRAIQTYIGTELRNPEVTPEEWWESYDEQRVASIEPVLRGEKEPKEVFGGIPRPYIEVGCDLSLTKVQEGRHRTIAAERVGLETLPVTIVHDLKRTGVVGEKTT